MASRRVSFRLQPLQEDDEEDEEDEDEEDEDESDTDSEDDTSSSDADTEPEMAVNLVQRPGPARDSAIEVDEETEDEEEVHEEGSEGEEEEIKGRVENGEEKRKENVGIELGDNSVLPTCPVCMEVWTSEGPHRVCCIPCGHLYGRLCLEKWLRKCGNKGKCPQCNGKFDPKQIINLYAPRIVVPNDDLEKEVNSLREKNESLTLEKARLLEEISKQREQLEEQRSKRQKIRQTSLLEFSDQRQKLSIGALSGNTATFPGRIVLQEHS